MLAIYTNVPYLSHFTHESSNLTYKSRMSNRYILLIVLAVLSFPMLSCGELNEYFYNSTSGEPKYLFQDLLELMMSFGPGGDELGLMACVPVPSGAHVDVANLVLHGDPVTGCDPWEMDSSYQDTCYWSYDGLPYGFNLRCTGGLWTLDILPDTTCTSATGPDGSYTCNRPDYWPAVCDTPSATVTGAVCPADCSGCATSCFLEGTTIITVSNQVTGLPEDP